MFDHLTDRLSRTLRNISGRGRLTEANIKDTVREIRMALLEADVALPVIRDFISRVKENALGQAVNKRFTPGQGFVKIVRAELVKALGEANNALNLVGVPPPAVVMLAGLPGVGKTTSVGKLGNYLREQQKKQVLVVSADVYRPAAIKQLETLAHKVGVDFFSSDDIAQTPLDIVHLALNQAKRLFYDVLLVDTAGCLPVDETMMAEIIAIHADIQPIETIFVVDAMTGQDAAHTAQNFNQALPLTGVILTKVDGDARGGAALSIRHITGKQIKFMGVGEKMDALEPFYPNRLAGQILGMGDVLSIIEDLEREIKREQANKLTNQLNKGDSFDLTDLLVQIKHLRNMGGIASLMSKLPGFCQLPAQVQSQMDDKVILHMEALINSMTAKERVCPEIINSSRKLRIAAGSGMQVNDVNRLLKQLDIISTMKKGGIANIMRQMKERV
ncbi:Signal recognition particle protein [Candidatus Moranella endobia PCVAL]|uniref:signal recognition particle protein n=1 Tax=Candidatus Moranella endobia TaxID=1048758 RepID=UPI0002C69DC8|nr:Signal recognition particle protein [Candidatus Moranella endobia PCVAL]